MTEAPRSGGARNQAAEALALFALSGTLLVFFGPLCAPLGLPGLALAQLLFLAAPPLALARARGPGALARLGVIAPRTAPLCGALLVGVSFWYLNLIIAIPLAERLAGDPRELERLTRELLGGGGSLALRLGVVALTPALCEELLLRGGVARGLRPQLGLGGAIAVSALLFAALHLSFVRFLPTALFGAVLGYAALAGGSTVLAALIHFLNNAVAVLLASPGAAALHGPLERHPWPAAALALVLSGAGLGLLGAPSASERTS